MMLKKFTLVLLWMNLMAISIFLYWYIFHEGYLGYGYGEMVYFAFILVCYIAVCFLLFFKHRLNQSLPAILLGLFAFDFWFASLLLGFHTP